MNVRPLAEQDNLKPWLDDDLRSHGSLVGVDVWDPGRSGKAEWGGRDDKR
jgi:hypothetical protein